MVPGKKAKKQIQNLRQKKSKNYSTHLKWQIFIARVCALQGTPNLSNQQHAILERNASFCCFSRCIASSRGLFASLEDILQMLQGYCFHRVCQERTSHSVKECYMSFRTKIHFKDHHMPKNNFKMLKLAIFDHWMLERAYPFNEPVRRKQHFLQAALHFQKGQLTGRWCKFQKSADISCRMIVSAMISLFFLSGK